MKSNNLLLFTVTFCGTGLLSKRMPGTIGSLAATSLSYMIPKYSIVFYIISILSFVIGTITSQQYVNKHPENKDPGFIVIDEACAIFLSNAVLLDIFEYSYTIFLLSFIFFRIFDILKPFPINKIDSYFKRIDVNNTHVEVQNISDSNNIEVKTSINNNNSNTNKNNLIQNNVNINNANISNSNNEKIDDNCSTSNINSNQENINNNTENYNNHNINLEKDLNTNNKKYYCKRFLNGFGIMIDDIIAVIPTIITIIIVSYVIQVILFIKL